MKNASIDISIEMYIIWNFMPSTSLKAFYLYLHFKQTPPPFLNGLLKK